MWIFMALVAAAGVAYLVYLWVSFKPSVERYCPACKKMRPWHPTKGCSVCRTLDSVF